MKLEGKVVFVTGAGSGLGAEICRLFAAEGARVMATDIDEASAAAVAAQCAESTAGATSAHCDVADSKSVSSFRLCSTNRLGAKWTFPSSVTTRAPRKLCCW